MATVVHSESKRMYSWWWDSHISPKNSKWLLENLADMDTKVKSMIKLIEEDGDTFAKRAEMYYRKRPELLQLVEGFYRAYRALAERYDHARVGLRHAHKTIAEVYPDQVPSLGDDLSDFDDSHTFENPFFSSFNMDSLSEVTSGLSSSNSSSSRWNGEKGLKQFSEMFKFEEALKSLKLVQSAEGLASTSDGSLDSLCKNEAGNELEALRLAVAEMQAEKESVVFQYHQSLEKLSNLESKLNITEDDVRAFDVQMREADIEIGQLKEALTSSEAEKDAHLFQCQKLLDLKTKLEAEVSKALEDAKEFEERALKAETEVQNLKTEVLRVDAEKEATTLLYEQCLGKISLLEDKLLSAEENVRQLTERNEVAEADLKRLREAVNSLNEEKEAAARQFIQYSEIISKLKSELSGAHEDIDRLNSELLGGASKLKHAEEQCVLLDRTNQSLKSEIEEMIKMIISKDLDNAAKQNELEKLQFRIHEEQVQLLKVQASLSTWQKLHSQSQEDHKVLALELRNGLQMLKDLEISKHNLQEELHRAKAENQYLNDMKVSLTLKIHDLTNEAISSRDVKEKLENELARQVDLGNSLQQEICNLRFELENLNKKYQSLATQIESVGLRPESIGSSVKELLEQCSKLNEVCEQKQNENANLMGKLDNMSMVLQQNVALESSLLNVTVELVESKQKLKALQESSELLQSEKSSLIAEKADLVSQLQLITDKIQELLQKNSALEDSLSITNVELQVLRDESKNFEEIHQLLKNEKSIIQNEKDSLMAQLEDVERKLKISEVKFSKVEEKYAALEKDKLYTLQRIEELHASHGLEKQEYTCFKESSEARLAFLETRINLLNDEERSRKEEFEEREKAMRAEVEILMLQKLVMDLEEKNLSLMAECRQHADKSMITSKLIAQLDKENLAQQAETDFLLDEIEKLRSGIYCVFKALENGIDEEVEEQRYLSIIAQQVEMLKQDASTSADKNQQLQLHNSVLVTVIEQLKLEMAELQSTTIIDQERALQVSSGQGKKQKLLGSNKLLSLEASEEDHLAEFLNAERDDINAELLDLREKYIYLEEEYFKVQEENAALLNECSGLKKEKKDLEDENNSIVHESVLYSNLSSIFEGYGNEKDVQVKQLTESLDYLSDVNNDLERELETATQKLETKEKENLNLKESIQSMRKELFEVKDLNEQLYVEVLSGRKSLAKKELELSKAKQRLKVSDDVNREINATVEALKMECETSKLIYEDLGKQVLELSSDKMDLKREVKYLLEERLKLDSKLCELHEDLDMHRTREESLSAKLQVRCNQSELWKAEAEKYYSDLQVSAVSEVIYRNKLEQLVCVCADQEKESATRDAETEALKTKVCSLETELQELKAQLSAYPPVIDSLKGDITSLECIAHLRKKLLGKSDQRDLKEVAVATDSQRKSDSGRISDLEEMRLEIKMLEKAVSEDAEGHTKLETLKLKPQAITEGTENSNSTRSINQEKVIQTTNGNGLEHCRESWTTFSIASEDGNGLLMKDIPLDEVSDSSHGGNIQKANGVATDQMLELWEVAEQSHSRNSRVKGKHKKAYDTVYHQFKDVQREPQPTSIEFLVEKELSLDKQEIINTADSSQEDAKNKALEKLASDAKKLTNTQAMVQDVRVKLDTISKSKRTKEFEFETMREQLQEVEETSVQLMETNIRLRKNIEKGSSSSMGKSCADWEDIGSSRRRRVYEQAKKSSEKIGRLHLEAQKIQGVVQNIQSEKKSASTAGVYRFSQARTNILLRTFIGRGSRNGRRQRNPCFGCMQPVTN